MSVMRPGANKSGPPLAVLSMTLVDGWWLMRLSFALALSLCARYHHPNFIKKNKKRIELDTKRKAMVFSAGFHLKHDALFV